MSPSTSSSSSSAAKKIKEETLEPHAGAPVPVVATDDYNEPDEATNDEYLEGDDDPSTMLESQDDYNLDTSQGESMAYEGDPNNPGVSTHFVVSVLTCIFYNIDFSRWNLSKLSSFCLI